MINPRTFVRQQSQTLVWAAVVALPITVLLILLAMFAPPYDPKTDFTTIECRSGGVVLAEGYANRDGVYRQTIYTENGLKRTLTLVPGIYCDRSMVPLRRSELPEYLRNVK